MAIPSAPFATSKAVANSTGIGDLTLDQVVNAVPTNLRASITQGMVDTINQISADPLIADNIRQNFIGYSAVLKEGKFKTEDYLNAVAYVSYKLMGYNNEEAYARTFVKRYTDLVAKGTNRKDISSYVHAFHKNKLVNLIMEQCLMPTWVLNQDMFQDALNTQADLMRNAVSEKVRTDAANSILTHLKKPEKNNFQINLDTVEPSGVREMRQMLQELADTQKQLIDNNQMKTIDVAASKMVIVNDDE